ncbi:MAG TPA: chromate transporter [Clostridia bacterium]|nr:chromate transporter [Clostridia bacterium]
MIYLKLLFTFMKIGLFSFGGGYAMIPLIQKEIESNGWLTSAEFVDIIAISEMTPGPIAVNTATFVGYRTAGLVGGLAATAGVAIPSLVLILLVSKFFFGFRKHPLNTLVFYGIRPVIAGLIVTAAVFVAETAILRQEAPIIAIGQLVNNPGTIINFGSIAILTATLIEIVKFRLHPIMAIMLSGFMGVMLFHVL